MSNRVPTYALYGEYLEEVHEDVLHFEPLRDRSERHDWTIQPHKHDTLWQIFYFDDPGITVRLGEETMKTTEAVFISIPPLFVHAFQFPKNANGGVISVRFPEVKQFVDNLWDSAHLKDQTLVIDQGAKEFSPMLRAYDQIKAEFHHIDHLRHAGLEAALTAMLICLSRFVQSQDQTEQLNPGHFGDDLMRRFCLLVEENFDSGWTTENFADQLGVSSVSLNRRCRSILGTSPQRLLAKRRIMEAKRLLQFTRLSVHDIADQLAFADPSYFCRVFKRQCGQTPAAYRRANSD